MISQDFHRIHYDVNNGLPSSEIFDILEDSTGYLWFLTPYGVSRYDGYEFKNYTTHDGLTENSMVVGFLDRKGRPWFSGYNIGLSYFDQGEIKPYRFNDH